MADNQTSFLQRLEQFWHSDTTPPETSYEMFLVFEKNMNNKRLSKSNKTVLALTAIMLLRQLTQNAEADSLESKSLAALNRINNPLYRHRWKRLQLIEAFRTGKKDAAINDVIALVAEAEKNGWIEEQLRALFLKHLVEKFGGQFSKALHTAQQVKLLANEHEHAYYMQQSAWAVPHIYYYFDEKKLAFEECLLVKGLFSTDFSQPQNRGFYLLLGDCYAEFKHYDKALEIYNQLLDHIKTSANPDNALYISILGNTAHIFQQQKELQKAEAGLKEAENISRQMGWPMYSLSLLLSMADIYYQTRRYSQMQQALAEAQKLTAQVKVVTYEVRLLELKAMYAKVKRPAKDALQAYEKYHQRYDEWKKIDNQEKLKALETKQQLELQQLNHEMMKKELQLRDQEMQLLNSLLTQKNKLIGQFSDYFNELEETSIRRKEIFTRLREMVHTIKNTQQEGQGNYSARFNDVHNKACAMLIAKYSTISGKEADTAIMLTQGLSNKEISTLTLTTVRNIEKHRLNLRKKMKVKKGEDLIRKIRLVTSAD